MRPRSLHVLHFDARTCELQLNCNSPVNTRDTDIQPLFQINKGATELMPWLRPNTRFSTCQISGDDTGCFQASNEPGNYTTAVIGNASVAWIEKVVAEDRNRPFFAYIAPKAAHEPFNPAPWYEGYWHDDWPQREPRPESWNSSKNERMYHHGNVREL